MAIEFSCSQCGKLLSVGDDAEGKQARCPACGSVQAIPFTSPPAGAGLGENPFGAPGARPAAGPENPYASPAPLPEMPSLPPVGEYWGPRSGPPWEREGASFNSFWATVKLIYSSPQVFFREMRREGGLWPPLSFAFIGGIIGGLAAGCYNIGLQSLVLLAPNNQANGAPGPASLAFGAIMILVMVPVGVLIQAFVTSGIYHVCLMILGGAKQPYETTFRVVCYVTGASGLLGLIPLCGAVIQGIYALVLAGMGLSYSHETSGVKAAFAVVLPVLLCCGAAVLFYGAIIAMLVAGANGR